MSQEFKIEDLDATGVVCEREFLLEGLEALNGSIRGNGNSISIDTFFKTTLMVADDPSSGFVRKFSSVNSKPLAFMVAFVSNPPFKPPTLLVYAYYSNNKSGTITRFALDRAEMWARRNNIGSLSAYSYRMSGSVFRLFESIWGFQRQAILFSKSL